MEPITGSLAVIGLADVVLRTGKELFTFISSVKHASQSQKELQSDLKSLASVVENLRSFLITSNQHPQLARSALDSNILHSLQEIYAELLALERGTSVKTVWDKIKWVKEQGKVRRLSQRLQGYECTLNTLLLLSMSQV